MARERKKPEGSFIERAKNEIENEDTLLTNRAYELGRIRGRKEQEETDEVKYKKLRTLAYDMYTSVQYLSTDASKLSRAMDAFQQYVCYEESEEE